MANDDDDIASLFNEFDEDCEFLERVNHENIDISDLNNLNGCKYFSKKQQLKWRDGPMQSNGGPSSEIKFATLEVHREDGEILYNRKYDAIKSLDHTNAEIADRALLEYFADLHSADVFDFEFVSLILQHADVNVTDIHGQTLLHEIAREWHVDIARFLKLKGINIDVADKWGRTPLFVAAASDNIPMLKWLLENGANMYHRTLAGEEQLAIHYAAKYDAVNAFDILMQFGVEPLLRDARMKTAFHIAAEAGHLAMCKHMLDLEFPVMTYDITGIPVMSHIIANLPTDLAIRGLDQFVYACKRERKKKYYLNCLSTQRVKLLRQNSGMMLPSKYMTLMHPLEMVVVGRDAKLITHPISKQYLEVATSGSYGFQMRLNLFLSLTFVVLWTSAAVISGHSHEDENIPVIVCSTLAQVIGFYQSYKLCHQFIVFKHHIKRLHLEIMENARALAAFCHPRWPMERSFLEQKSGQAKSVKRNFWNAWNIIDGFCLLLSFGLWCFLWLSAIVPHSEETDALRKSYVTVFVLLIWIRLNKDLRRLQSIGPYVAMLQECVYAFLKLFFLYFEFAFPFLIAIWITFGGERKGADEHSAYLTFQNTIYQVYLLSFIGDYDYDTLKKVDKTSSQLIVGIYFILVSVITLNLLIALLSLAFSEVYSKAMAVAYLVEAEELLDIERRYPEQARSFGMNLLENYSPLVLYSDKNQQHDNPREILKIVFSKAQNIKEELNSIIKDQNKIYENTRRAAEEMAVFQRKRDVDNTNRIVDMLNEISSERDGVFYKLQRGLLKLQKKIQNGTKII